jgi:hypothetical protein
MIERILITVKTYPTLSEKYAELVCTAGVNEAGEWRRIYPIQFRQLVDENKYKKFQWIDVDLEKSTTDGRPESYKIRDGTKLELNGQPLGTNNNWSARREEFLDKVETHRDLGFLIKVAHENEVSLGLFEPKEWLNFTVEQVERNWDPVKLAKLESQKKQLDIFKDQETVEQELTIVRKLPYKFSYQFEDINGKKSKLMIEDWEIGALFWKYARDPAGDEKIAVQKVREKYWDEFVQSGRYAPLLILGTTLEHHNKSAPNPFVIIGVVAPPPQSHQQPTFSF